MVVLRVRNKPCFCYSFKIFVVMLNSKVSIEKVIDRTVNDTAITVELL